MPAIAAEWQGHLADGLAALRRTPSGAVRSLCDAILADPAHYTHDLLVRMAAGDLSQAERMRNAHALQQFQGPDTVAVFLLRGGYGFRIAAAQDPIERARLQAELEALGDVQTPSAPALRKALFPLLSARFGGKPAKLRGTEYQVPLGPVGTASLALRLDFGGMARGLRWAVTVTGAGGLRYGAASYEELLGLPAPEWDVLRTDRLNDDLALLLERVEGCLSLVRGVVWD